MDALWTGAQEALGDIRQAVFEADGSKLRRGTSRLIARMQEAGDERFSESAARWFAEAVQDAFEKGWRHQFAQNQASQGEGHGWLDFPNACSHLALLIKKGGAEEELLVSRAIETMARSAAEERLHYQGLKSAQEKDTLGWGSSFCAALGVLDCCREKNPDFGLQASAAVGLMMKAWDIDLDAPASMRWKKLHKNNTWKSDFFWIVHFDGLDEAGLRQAEAAGESALAQEAARRRHEGAPVPKAAKPARPPRR